jgi:hypothetical protein
MESPTCLCGNKNGWVSVETVITPRHNNGVEQRTGIFSYICSCGTRVPYDVWIRAAEVEEGANLQSHNSKNAKDDPDDIAYLRSNECAMHANDCEGY